MIYTLSGQNLEGKIKDGNMTRTIYKLSVFIYTIFYGQGEGNPVTSGHKVLSNDHYEPISIVWKRRIRLELLRVVLVMAIII